MSQKRCSDPEREPGALTLARMQNSGMCGGGLGLEATKEEGEAFLVSGWERRRSKWSFP